MAEILDPHNLPNNDFGPEKFVFIHAKIDGDLKSFIRISNPEKKLIETENIGKLFEKNLAEKSIVYTEISYTGATIERHKNTISISRTSSNIPMSNEEKDMAVKFLKIYFPECEITRVAF